MVVLHGVQHFLGGFRFRSSPSYDKEPIIVYSEERPCAESGPMKFLIGFFIGIIIFFLFLNVRARSKIEQPISFNHKRHIAQGLECDTCHPYFKTRNFAGMPRIETCMDCHQDPLTDSPEEQKIKKFQEKGLEIRWKRLYQQPDHVFFSHRRHVVLGKMDCSSCHGEMGRTERPPSRPWVKMTMEWCMDCHRKTEVTNDCLACHV